MNRSADRQKSIKGRLSAAFAIVSAAVILLCGCRGAQGSKEPDTGASDQQITEADDVQNATVNPETDDGLTSDRTNLADSLDQAVIRQIDEETGRILLYSKLAGKSYFLTYDSSTVIKDRYDGQLVAGQLESGDLVTVSFRKNEHKARGIWVDPLMESNVAEGNFSIHINAATVEIGQQQFSLGKDSVVLSKGKLVSVEDINENDTLRACIKDTEVYALVITRGHGYVRLLGADAFEGGFLEFGQDRIMKVEKDGLYVVPEGAYQMMISKGSDFGVKEIEVEPDKELLVDVSDIVTDADRTGQIVFTITPAEALLKIDDTETDFSTAVEIPYGIHRVEVSAEGYKSVSQFIKVGSPASNLSIDLEKGEEKNTSDDNGNDNSSVSDNSASQLNAAQPQTEGEYRVYIDGPAQAELYVDDAYVGIVPASFPKKSGKHVISLRRDGYITRSYTLDIDSGNNDNHYSFSSLKSNAASDTDLAQTALSSLISDTLSGL